MTTKQTTKNRAAKAREQAGLSFGQAAKLLGIKREDLIGIEEIDEAFFALDDDLRDLMLDIYGVNYPWLAGEAPLHDYASVDAMEGADKLSFKDRGSLAELMASRPRDVGGAQEILDTARKRAMARRK